MISGKNTVLEVEDQRSILSMVEWAKKSCVNCVKVPETVFFLEATIFPHVRIIDVWIRINTGADLHCSTCNFLHKMTH